MRVNILDVNDNAPVFDNAGSEITAAVPTTAEYGHPVTRAQVIITVYIAIQCNTMYITIQYNTKQNNTIQYNT